MIKKSVIIFVLLFAYLLSINSKELTIKIIDKDIDIPLEGVAVKIGLINETFYTDETGVLKVELPDDVKRAIITCSLLGYENFKINLNEFNKPLEIKMSTEGFIQGEELVIEESYYNKIDKVGSTKLVDKEELKANAMRGLMEDVMNAVKALPGVSYSSSFYTMLSIRGSYYDEVSASLDGFVVRYPYFWGG
ncbi:MAG TPA: hypothetical protein PLO89_10045, partial [Spirochaetota bacterium]|nr:hypothetical protein [Spirochaetota bacterium]